MKQMRLLAGIFFLMSQSMLVYTLSAAGKPVENPLKIKVITDKKDALYKVGEPIVFEIQLLENDKPLAGKKLVYYLRKDGAKSENGTIVSTETPVQVKTTLEQPGFALCRVIYKPETGKQIRGYGGAGAEPLKINTARPTPKDFDQFWTEKIAELEKDPMKPELTPVPAPKHLQGKVECFDVKINCPGGAPVSGYFARPVGAKPKSLPAFISYHGAGVRSASNPYWRAAKGILSLDINAHGIENGKPKKYYVGLRSGKYKGYPYWNSNDKEKIYFLGMFLRVIRSLQFIKSQPEWDGKTLIVYGGSQGGGQSLVAAGIDPQVSFCVAMVPALCDHMGILEQRQSGWPRFIRVGRDGKPVDPKVVETVPYFDAANFAKRINADSIVSVGFIDTTCCPTSVYAAYNNIKGKKEIINNPLFGHRNPRETTTVISKKVAEHIETQKTK